MSDKTPETKQTITQFVKHLNDKNYAEANKFLKKTIETKLFERIRPMKSINIFKQ